MTAGDNTERKLSEEKVRESEQFYRSLFENMLDGFAYCRMLFDDHNRPVDFVYLDVNAAFEQLTGLKNVVGKKATEVFPGIRDLHLELFEIYGRVALTGKPEKFEIDFKPLAQCLSISAYSTGKGYFTAVFDDITERKLVEEKLQASEKIFECFMEYSPSFIYIKNENGRALKLSKNFEAMLGKPVMELLGKPMESLFPPKLAKSMVEDDMRVLKEGKTITVEEELNGRFYTTTKFPLSLEGKPRYLAGHTVDITERKMVEEKLRSSEEHFRELADSITDVFFAMDRDLRYTYWNRASEALIGVPAKDAVGKSIFELFPDNEETRTAVKAYREVLETGHPKVFLSKYHLGGKRYVFEISAYPATGGLSVFTRNITERIRTEAERDRMFNLSPDLMSVTGFDGYFKQMNPAWERTLGWTNEELFSKPIFDFIHPDDRKATADVFRDFSEGKEVREFENRYLHKDGSYRWISWNSFPLVEERLIFAVARDVTGRKQMEDELKVRINDLEKSRSAILYLLKDVSRAYEERKKAEEEVRKLNAELEQRVRNRTAQLEDSNKELEAFAYSVSHDLRAPLRSVDGFSQALLNEYSDKLDAQGKDYLQRVRANTQRMAQLIDDTLKLSRVTRSDMAIGTVDLSEIAKSIAFELQRTQPERLVDFIIAPGLVVAGDKQLLSMVMENLLGNAWKFTGNHAHARIEFGAIQKDGKPVYFVRDDGVGFDMNYADKLFVPFQRMHSWTEFPGTGIGLAIVQRIIHRHGGNVWADGEVEKGATFYFTTNANNL